MSDYNYAVERMCETIALIELGCLCLTKNKDGKEIGMPDVDRFYRYVQNEKLETLGKSVDEVVNIVKNDYPYIFEVSKNISTSAYMSMARTNKKDRKWLNTEFRKQLQLGFCICAMWTDNALKKEFHLEDEQIKNFFERVQDMIFGYQNKMVTIEKMNQAFIDDFGYDLVNGKEVRND